MEKEEAIREIKRFMNILPNDMQEAIMALVPELAESEDEKMLNELQGFLDSFGADYFGTGEWQKFHDWLEKQKESLHISETCKENQYSFTDEPKEMSVDEAMAYLDEKIAKARASKSWEGVDVDKFMDEIRGRDEADSEN